MDEAAALKRAAASAAASEVCEGMVLGLGTGSTVTHFLDILGERIQDGDLGDVVGVPTSVRTASAAHAKGIRITNLEDHPVLDLTVDGADEVDPSLNLIKGLGGALLREKVVAQSSQRVLIIVDEGKLVDRLGSDAPLPVEVVPFGWTTVRRHLSDREVQAVLREDEGEPYVTDNGNYVLDCRFPDGLGDLASLDRELRARAGLLETGLFLGIADAVLVGTEDGVRELRRTDDTRS